MMASRCSECSAFMTSEKPFDLAAAPGTRHHRLLNSNEAPMDSDSTFAKSVIAEARARLTVVEHEILRLRERMKCLEEEHVSLSGHLVENNSILSPLRQIPPEVLGEIFAWTLPSVGALREPGVFGVEYSPWVLTYISSRWRAVALSIPSLWSLVVIQPTYQFWYPLSMVKAQIQRAQSLKIHFYGFRRRDSPQIEMFQCLAEHSSRWQELSIRLTSDLVPLLAGLRDRLPSLRRLWIEWSGLESQTGVQSIDCFERAPSLVDVAIFNQYRYVPTLLPAHQLTCYDIDGPWDMHRAILALSQNLIQARIVINFDAEFWPDSGKIIHLSHLQRLFLSHADILAYITAPVLQQIAFRILKEEDPKYLLHLGPFMLRSGCTLQRFSLNGSPTTDTVAEILRQYPTITELAIVHNSNRSLSDLISHLTVPAMYPQLSDISFGCYNDRSYIDYTVFLQMLQSRWKAKDCALKSAALLRHSGMYGTLHALDVLRREGMDILVLHGLEASTLMDTWLYIPNWTQ